ncbi:MAG: hypothetical protein AB7W59_19445 [Acidimicrobiia bacterium]
MFDDSDQLPDGTRVLIAGHLPFQRKNPSLAAKTSEAVSRAWTEELIRKLLGLDPRSVIINGGRKGKIDEVVHDTVDGLMLSDPEFNANRIRTYAASEERRIVPNPHGWVRKDLPSRFTRRVLMVKLADVVVIIGGGTGASDIVGVAQALGKPIVPLPFGGELAGELFAEHWESDIAPSIRTALQKPDWPSPTKAEGWVAGPNSVQEAAELIMAAAEIPVFISQSHVDQSACDVAAKVVSCAEAAGYRPYRQFSAGTIDWIAADLGHRIHRSVLTIAIVWDHRYRFSECQPDGTELDRLSVNANVAFEVGYSIGRGQPTLIITKEAVERPFNIDGLRAIDSSANGWVDELVVALDSFRRDRTLRRHDSP